MRDATRRTLLRTPAVFSVAATGLVLFVDFGGSIDDQCSILVMARPPATTSPTSTPTTATAPGGGSAPTRSG